jgi:hypothetical protein
MRIAHAAHENVGYVVGERALPRTTRRCYRALREVLDATSRAITLLELRVGPDALPPP